MIYRYLAEGGTRYALYNLTIDPSESRNLASDEPKRLKAMVDENEIKPDSDEPPVKPEASNLSRSKRLSIVVGLLV